MIMIMLMMMMMLAVQLLAKVVALLQLENWLFFLQTDVQSLNFRHCTAAIGNSFKIGSFLQTDVDEILKRMKLN